MKKLGAVIFGGVMGVSILVAFLLAFSDNAVALTRQEAIDKCNAMWSYGMLDKENEVRCFGNIARDAGEQKKECEGAGGVFHDSDVMPTCNFAYSSSSSGGGNGGDSSDSNSPSNSADNSAAAKACEQLPSYYYTSQSSSIKCYMSDPASTKCKNVGGTFIGKEGDDYVCVIPFNIGGNSSSGGSSGNGSGNSGNSGNAGSNRQSSGAIFDNEEDSDDLSGAGSPGGGGSTARRMGGGNANETIQNNKCGDGAITGFFGNGCIDANSNGIFMVLNVILQVLTWGVGIAGTLGLVITGVQITTAKDDAQMLAKAKKRLIYIIVGMMLYAVMWAFLQWLLPGGVFGN